LAAVGQTDDNLIDNFTLRYNSDFEVEKFEDKKFKRASFLVSKKINLSGWLFTLVKL
jgi:hypothetical protein